LPDPGSTPCGVVLERKRAALRFVTSSGRREGLSALVVEQDP